MRASTRGLAAVGGQDAAGGGEIDIALQNPNRYPEAAARRLRPWLAALLAELAPAGCRSLGVRFAGDRGMRRVNRLYRGKDQTTDVLSFPGGGEGGGGGGEGGSAARGGGGEGSAPAAAAGHLGDILISVPAARRQAAAAGGDPQVEVQVLLLHGVLHCLGYDHEVDGGEMERLERRLRRRWIGRSVPGQRGEGTPAERRAPGPSGRGAASRVGHGGEARRARSAG
jgi:probable rRNA maturation factor